MISLHSFIKGALIGLALQLPGVAGAQSKRDWQLSDAPSSSLFLRRAYATVTVLGDYAYIDGGEVSQLDADGNPIKSPSSNAVNSTLSIDLSKSWSASNVTIRQISKEAQPRDGQALWKHEATNTFYIWGGHSPYGAPIDNPTSWKFQADGKGGGEWTKETPANPTLFTQLRRNEEGAFASTPDGGFWFGGGASGWTDFNVYTQAVPGILSYNMTTKSWANETTDAFSDYGTLIGGAAVYIPTFGPNGLITVLGGSTWGLEPDQKKPLGWLDFNNLTLFDPVTKDWYWQKTTGNAPTSRRNFCTVGAEGTNGTYEIFVFGGIYSDSGSTFDDVFVLSLPGFVWTQVPYESKIPRKLHSCAVIGHRQMLSVGGTDGKTGYSGADPWPQGLGLFDMTEWTWKTEYDAAAKEYESAATIQEWYKEVGISSVKWSSDDVKNLFNPNASKTAEESNPDSTETSPANSTATQGSDQNPTDKEGSGTKSVPVAAIAGATVGAVVGVIAVFVGFCFIRRRKQKKAAADELAPSHASDERSASETLYESLQASELHANAPQPKQEMWAHVPQSEMEATGGHHHTVAELEAQEGLLRHGRNDGAKYRHDI